MARFGIPTQLKDAKEALEYRNRAVHDGYVIVDIGPKNQRISLKICPNPNALVASPPFPPQAVWLMDKVHTWTQALFDICNRVYDITGQKLRSGEKAPLSLP